MHDQVKDKGLTESLTAAKHWFNDVQVGYLNRLGSETRTPMEESAWLDGTERQMRLATDKLERLQKSFDTYGANLETR